MGIKDIFKKFKEDKSSFHPSPSKEGSEKKEPTKKAEPAKEPKELKEKVKPVEKPKPVRTVKKGKFSEAYRVLKAPHVTEKATDLTEKNQYIFRVWPGVNKNEIKKAIESLYGVEVTSVKIIKVPAKKRRLGRIEGFRKSYKKAIVKIKKGQKIEVLPR